MHKRLCILFSVLFLSCTPQKNNISADSADTAELEDVVQIPDGPIPPPEGTDTAPEEEDFSYFGVHSQRISSSLPEQELEWTDYPQTGTASFLTWSDSEECVCFDLQCSTCSEEDCSAETCTYALNDNHALTKYHIELQSTTNPEHSIHFEVNISAAPAIDYTDIEDVMRELERIPPEYWYGLRIITDFGRGIQFLHGSYFSGADAYGRHGLHRHPDRVCAHTVARAGAHL